MARPEDAAVPPRTDLVGRAALVIPTWNGGPRFEQVLAAWRRQQGVDPLDIVCPDSGSSDGTVDVIRRFEARHVAVDQATFSHGGTRNDAVAGLDHEFVILSVQDALPVDDRLAQALLAPLVDDPDLCATFGRQVPLPGAHPILVSRIGDWAGGEELEIQELGGRDWDTLDPWERLRLIRYDHVIACMRRSVWEQHPFAPVSFGEDVDWAHRVIRAGGRLAFVPDAVVEHSHERPAWDEARRIYCDHRNLKRLVGLTTVPRLADLRRNVPAARAHYRQLVDGAEGVDEATRQRWQAWGHDLALYENWAQYLGANWSRRWWFRPIDRWLRRGI